MDLIIFALIAVYFMYKLNNVLGNKDYNHEEHKAKIIMEFLDPVKERENQEKIINTNIEITEEEAITSDDPVIRNLIKDIRKFDKNFVEKSFLKSASSVFEIILTSFSKNDKETLKMLLSENLYKKFLHHIESQQKQNLTTQRSIVSIDEAKIIKGKITNNIAFLTVQFISEQIYNVKDKDGKLIEGDSDKIEKKTDLWSFQRNLKSDLPAWELISTE